MPHNLEQVLETIRQHPKLVSVDDYEISLQETEGLSGKFQRGKLISKNKEESLWVQLRVLLRRQPGQASILFTDEGDIQRLVDCTFEAAENSSPDPWFRFPLVKIAKAADLRPSENFLSLPSPLSQDGDDVALEENYETWVQKGVLCRRVEKIEGSYKRTCQAARVRPLEGNSPGDYQVCGVEWAGRDKNFLGVREIERWKKNAKPFKNINVKRVLCRPRFLAQLLQEVGEWFCADKAQAFLSPFSDKEGQKIFSPLIHLIDEGEIENGINSFPFDVEGSSPKRTVLVDKGTLQGFLHNSYTAARANRPSTGNFLRDPHQIAPQIAPTHLYFAPGTQDGDLSAQMGEGFSLEALDKLYVVPGVGTEIYFRASGWAMHGGNRVAYFTGICGKWDVTEVLQRVVAVGKDLAFYGHCGSPSILLENVPLSEER